MNPEPTCSSSGARFGAPHRAARRLVFLGVLASAVVLTGCSAAIAAGAVGVAAVIAFAGYGCGEPVDVTVWDRKTAHPICDATVTAEQKGSSHEFSPCYRLHLGDGAWTVKAAKPGYVTAVGSVTVNKERRCSEPTFHSVVLTLLPIGEAPPPPVQVAPESPAPASSAPATPASSAPATPASSAPATAPSSAPAAPASSAPATPAPSGAPAPPSAKFPAAPPSP